MAPLILAPASSSTRAPGWGLTVRARLTAVLFVLCGTALVTSAFLYFTTNALIADLTNRAEATLGTALAHSELTRAYSDEESGVRGYELTSDETFMQPYTAGLARETALLATLTVATAGDAAAADALEAVKTHADAWHGEYVDRVTGQIGAGDIATPRSLASLSNGKRLFDNLRQSLTSLEEALGRPDAAFISRNEFIAGVRTGLGFLSALLLIVSVLVAGRIVRRWVTQPLERLVHTAHRVESGEHVSFVPERNDEIGSLGAALEGMRGRLQAAQDAAESSAHRSTIVNRFTELTGFLGQDAQVAEAVLVALDQLGAPDRAVVHISNRSQDRATLEARRGDVDATSLTLNALAECPGIKRGGLYVAPDVSAPLAVRCPVFPADSGTVACIPLAAIGESVGAAHVQWNRIDALPLDQRPAVMRIAEHSALAIANRRLLLALQGMASTDARTGLANTRAFDTALETALGASGRGNVSVLLLDLDHFKLFNDRYGHPAGDEALRAFAGILSGSVRDGELVARYGGEEFAVLLRGLDTPEAAAVAERIRSRTDATILSLGPGTTAHISVSVGVATAPSDAFERIGLLRAADAALYRAKAQGRNRVETASRGATDPEAILQAS